MEDSVFLDLALHLVIHVNSVAMPSGYKLVITRALGMHGIYCTQPSGRKTVS